MNKIKSMFKSNMHQYGMIIIVVVLIVIFQISTGGLLLTPLNVTNIILQNSYILILTVGMLPIILTGRIDLAAGSVVGFIGAVTALLMTKWGLGFIPAILIGLLLGALIGVWQGYWVAYRNIPAFIVTLSSSLVFRGLTILTLNGRSIGPFSIEFQSMSSGFIPDIVQGSKYHIVTIIVGVLICGWLVMRELSKSSSQRKHGMMSMPLWQTLVKTVALCAVVLIFVYYFAAYQGIPNVLVLMGILVIAYTFITQNTIIGRRIYAIGGNERASMLSGINTKKLIMLSFVNMGVFAALAGMVFAARLNSATPKAGNGFELDAIAACYIGGASVSGGIGTVMGAVLGCFIMGIMNNGMSIMGVPIDLQQAIKGLVILFAVAFDMYAKSKE